MLAAALCAIGGRTSAGDSGNDSGNISYDPEEQRVLVAGFPEDRPATLSDVLAADERSGWGVIAHEPGSDTFTLEASLWIGTNTDWGTFFQIGRPEHPDETLILHGDLTVAPARSTGRPVTHHSEREHAGGRYDGRYRVSNRLTLGVEGNPEIRPTVKIASTERGEFTVRVLADPPYPDRRWYRPMGELFMFNAVLTAMDAGNPYAAAIALSHAGLNYRFRDSTFSRWDGDLFQHVVVLVYGLGPEHRVVRGMIFEHGGTVGGQFNAVDCVFRNLDEARRNVGAVCCVFENNRIHVRLTGSHTGVIFTDCVFDEPAVPLRVPRSTRDERWLRNYSVYRESSDLSMVMNPGVIERTSLHVRVTDASGRPVRRAAVFISCPGDIDGLAVYRGLAVTDSDGLTPDDPEDGALVINRRELRPADDPEEPETVTHVFLLRVEAPGFAPKEIKLDGAGEIPRPLDISMTQYKP